MNKLYCNLNEYITIKQSGIFDADFYFQEYPDVRKADIDPLWHFIRFGWKEGRKPSRHFFTGSSVSLYDTSKENAPNNLLSKTKEELKLITNFTGKHIEFIGIPGSGKTTLYNQANQLLFKELGYRPGPTCLFLDILKDEKYQALNGNDLINLTSFLITKNSFIKAVGNSAKRFQYPEQLNDSLDIVMAYFYHFCTYYQALTTSAPTEWIMFDEGFYNFLAKFIIDLTGNIKGRIGNRILSTMPKVDLLIHVKSDVSTCIKRMRTREQGVPLPYQKLSSSQLQVFFSFYDNFFDKYCEVVKAKGIKTVELDNNQPLKKSMLKLSSEINYLL